MLWPRLLSLIFTLGGWEKIEEITQNAFAAEDEPSRAVDPQNQTSNELACLSHSRGRQAPNSESALDPGLSTPNP